MSPAVASPLQQILAASDDVQRKAFQQLAERLYLDTGMSRPIPFTDDNGNCIGVYWPKFVSTATEPPPISAEERAELLRRCATLEDSEDISQLLK